MLNTLLVARNLNPIMLLNIYQLPVAEAAISVQTITEVRLINKLLIFSFLTITSHRHHSRTELLTSICGHRTWQNGTKLRTKLCVRGHMEDQATDWYGHPPSVLGWMIKSGVCLWSLHVHEFKWRLHFVSCFFIEFKLNFSFWMYKLLF